MYKKCASSKTACISLSPPPISLEKEEMDIADIAKKLGLSKSKHVVRKAAELRRLADVQFDCSALGIGEICKAIICLEIAATRFEIMFDRQMLIKSSGMSEKAYIRSFNALQSALGVKNTLDVRELAIKFGCIRLIPFVQRGLASYKERYLKALPASRQSSADFTRPVFTAVAFYLCAKKHKLKVDKIKLIELCGTSESEFTSVSVTMKDLCHDVFGISKEKKDPKEVKGNRDLLDALPEKRRSEDGGYSSDEEEVSCYRKRKQMETHAYKDWKSTVLESNKEQVPAKRTKQAQLNFAKKGPEKKKVEAT